MNNIKIKITLVLAICSFAWMSQAQNVERKEKPVLPKAGDIGLGIDLVPVLDYVGNMFNGTLNNGWNIFGGEPALPIGVPAAPNVSISGRYMFTDNFSLRANVGLIGREISQQLYIRDDEAFAKNPLSEARITDTYKQSRSGMILSVGPELRRGYHRIQGYAGLNVIYGFEALQDEYQYGNAVTEINQRPARNNAGFVVAPTPIAFANWTQTYVTGRYHDGNAQYVGLEGVVGVEYYITSHLSLGGEVSLYAIQMFTGKSYQEQEGFNFLTNQVEQRTELIAPRSRMLSYGTDNLGAKLYMMFYF
jgi:hypothetical protein